MRAKKRSTAVPAAITAYTDAAGVKFDGDAPWDIKVQDGRLYKDIVRRGSLALGEGYVNGMWTCDRIDELFSRLLAVTPEVDITHGFDLSGQLRSMLIALGERLWNWQSHVRAHQVGQRHYDIDPRVYGAMLDSRRIYSCAYWQQATNLEEAQEHKLRLICEKLELEPGLRMLDMGCGWGGLARYAAEKYGVEVVGITVSAQQERYAKNETRGLPVKIILTDYRSQMLKQEKQFDRVVSVGMLEHVGRKNDTKFFSIAEEILKDNGLMLVQSIGSRLTNHQVDPWIDRYIFPNGRLPSAKQICSGFEKSFLLQDWENFGEDYDTTLMAWWKKFDESWPTLSQDLTPSFYRLWSYYLLSCAGLFRSKQGQLWQLVLSKPSRCLVYRSKRIAQGTNKEQNAASVRQIGS